MKCVRLLPKAGLEARAPPPPTTPPAAVVPVVLGPAPAALMPEEAVAPPRCSAIPRVPRRGDYRRTGRPALKRDAMPAPRIYYFLAHRGDRGISYFACFCMHPILPAPTNTCHTHTHIHTPSHRRTIMRTIIIPSTTVWSRLHADPTLPPRTRLRTERSPPAYRVAPHATMPLYHTPLKR